MGLDTTHDAFHGAYSAFNRFRQVVAKATGGSYPPHDEACLAELKARHPESTPTWWYFGDGYGEETHPGLYEFLMHSDCDGHIEPGVCDHLAREMEALLPAIEKIEESDPATGHLGRDGGYVAVARKFIEGCRLAYQSAERLEFH